MNDPRCTYSDLPTKQCNHCHPEARPNTSTLPVRPMRVVHPVAVQPPTSTPPPPRTIPTDTDDWDLNDYVTALCDHTTVTEPYRYLHSNDDGTLTPITERHRTTSPPLLQQLWSAAETSKGMDSGNARGYQSSPAASLEALDVAIEIERDVHKLLTQLGETDSGDHWPDTTDAVRHLGSLVAPGQHTTRKREARTIRSWWSAARVVTGWDLPAFRPHNTCPVCANLGTLRIKWPTGLCISCRTIWDSDHSGLLVEHIRAENHEDDQTEADCG